MMLRTFSIAAGQFFSIVFYGEDVNYFCLFGAILIVLGLYKIVIWEWYYMKESDILILSGWKSLISIILHLFWAIFIRL